ncbi:MAG TPA: DNA glycosylase, partial [Candidatus Baltobacteraceae bacterium]|nr:DNA glycosylase [Candidatus Baltobacteraceae bacterium]
MIQIPSPQPSPRLIAGRGRKYEKSSIIFPVRDYDLAATLDSGQVFRWRAESLGSQSWIGVVGNHFVRLTQIENGIRAETPVAVKDWNWLRDFLQTEIDLAAILKTFPDDEPMRQSVAACHGLRLLRQDPWECLASFILSSTKQIVQIRQIVSQLCECFGEQMNCRVEPTARLDSATGRTLQFSFPTPQRIASLTETQLRSCKMGFRAPNLLAAAREIAGGRLDLDAIRKMNYADAQHELMKLRGVG